MTELDDELGVEYYDDAGEQQAEGTGVLGEAIRHTVRTTARVAETIAGLPGDVVQLFNSMAIGIPEYIAGEELPRWRRAVEGRPQAPGMPPMLGGFESAPTSQELREGLTQPFLGEMAEPQSEVERFADNIAQDFAALAIPVKGKIPFARALGSSILANTGGEVAKIFGGEKAEAVAKMGLLFAGGMIGKGGGVKQHIRKLYKDMEASVPEGAEISAKGLSGKLDRVEAVLRKGDPGDKSKVEAFNKIKAIRDKIQSGVISVDEAIELNKSVNESIFSIGDLKRGQNQLYKVREALHDTLKEYGKESPEFLSKWQSANEAYAATEVSRKVGNWVKKNIKPKDYLYAGAALGAEGLFAGAPAAAATVGVGGALAATAYSAEVLKRISQSSALKKYYLNVVTNSINQNKAGFLRAMNQLDNGLKNSFEQEPYESVEFGDE